MQLNKLDNIVFLKDVESNVIEQAFIILKDNVNFKKFENDVGNPKEKKILLSEAEILINNELKINDLNFKEYRINKINKKYKILKIVNIILVGAIIFMILK